MFGVVVRNNKVVIFCIKLDGYFWDELLVVIIKDILIPFRILRICFSLFTFFAPTDPNLIFLAPLVYVL